MDGEVVIGVELNDSLIDKQISLLEEKLEGLIEEYEVLEKTEPFEGQEKQLIKMGNEIDNTKKKLSRLIQEKEKINKNGFGAITKQINNAGSSIEKVIKKVGKWALAIFGIRTAYNLIRNAMSTILAQDEQLQADVDYMKNAIAYTLEPVIRKIIELMKELMFYIQYIIYQWTGRNIFENANKSLKNANGEAKKLKKTLTGFDEVNVLSKNESGGGTTTPSFDLSAGIQENVPEWIKWIADNGDLIASIIGGITGALVALKLFGLDPIKSLGIGLAIAGIIYAIKNLIKFLKNPTFKSFIGILEGIAVAVAGIAILFEAWPVAIGAAIALVVIEIVKHFDEIKELFNKLIQWMDKNVLGALRWLFGPLGDIIYIPIKNAIELAKNSFEAFYGAIKRVIDGIVQLFKGDFLGGLTNIFGGLFDIMHAPLTAFVNTLKTMIPYILSLFRDMGTKIGQAVGGKFNSVINSVLGGVETVLNTPIKGINKLLTKINKIPGINLNKLNTISFPRLATGAIINQPGRGVPVGYAGEAGKEGILPLTDSRAMSELGQEIARYVNIKNFVDVNMDSRKINRVTEMSSNRQSILKNG